MGLGPCGADVFGAFQLYLDSNVMLGNVFEAFLGDLSVLQEGEARARALRRESLGAFLGECLSRFQR